MPPLAAAVAPPPPIRSTHSSYTEQIEGGYIDHAVSKFDTLPGVAIRYGVEVGEIRKMNGLVTDSHMFALPSLRIPLPGRHPTSYSPYNAATSPSNMDLLTPPQRRSSQQKVSSNMNNLQQFYGLKPPTSIFFSRGTGGCKMAESNEKSRTERKDSWIEKSFDSSDLPLMESVGAAEVSVDNYQHHWLQSEENFGWETPEKVLREENEASSRSSFFSITRKGLALRPKSTSRGSQASDDSEWSSSSSCSGDSSTAADVPGKVNKSYSYFNMPDQVENSFSWLLSSTKQMIKFDLLSLSASTLTRPLLEGPPIAARKFKASLD